jgi:hypothetical protein
MELWVIFFSAFHNNFLENSSNVDPDYLPSSMYKVLL